MKKHEFQMAVPSNDLDKLPIQMAIKLPYADWVKIHKSLDATDGDFWSAEHETARQIKELLKQFVSAVEPYKYTIEDTEE